MRGAKPVGQESMVGLVGTATEDLCPRGQVRIGPELWRAESSKAVLAGTSRAGNRKRGHDNARRTGQAG